MQNYLRPPKLATATDIVIGTDMKTRKGTSHILIRGPGCHQNFIPKRHYLVLAASGASDQDVWGVYGGCNFSWRVPMTPSAVVADFGSRRYRRFIPFNFFLFLAAPHLHCVLVLVTGNKFIAGVVVTGDNCSLLSLSPAIICSPVSTTPAITEYQ
jgi:hypothetical protein